MQRHAASVLAVIAVCVGCADAGSSSSRFQSSALNPAGAPTVAFSVPDMMCEDSCAATVKAILSKQPGVKEVRVDFAAKTAMVAIEEGQFDPQSAIAKLIDKGFDHTMLADEARASKPNAAD
jgi:copper chaperone CopZ